MTTMQEENFINILDGYVVNFIKLTKEQQDDVISRTFHKSLGGENNELS